MTFDDHSITSPHDQEFAELNNNATDQPEKVKSGNEPEKVINTLGNIISSYRNFQTKIEENKTLIQNLQSEMQVSMAQKESLAAELAEMPAPDSFKEHSEGGEDFSAGSDTFPADSSEGNKYSRDESGQQHDGTSTGQTTEIVANDQVVVDVSDSKSEVKTNTCLTIERYIEAIKNSIDHNSDHSEAYLQPLTASCNLLASQVKHIRLLEKLVAVFDEQRNLKAKEKEMHDIIDLLAEQFGD